MATYVHYQPSIISSFESTLCFGLPDPTTLLIVEVFLKYKRLIFLRNRRGELVDSYETNSDSYVYACFNSPRLSSDDLRAQIRLRVPGLSDSLCTQLSQQIFEYAVANENGGANIVTAFVEIKEPQLQPTDDDDQGQDYTGVRVDFDDYNEDGVVTYIENDDEDDEDDDDESSKAPRGLSWDEINGLKQESFKSGTAADEESLMCSICLEEFSTGVKITPLPCSHTFHHNCIASWLHKQASWPLCRFDISQECSSPSLNVVLAQL
ncbi:PREDICTED: uncharacterized protein LOC109187345 [Ipomoea nil]|uniref:uncharacterized protein LOC109187345 n=1 Tax=Ipomoea nil TaxID=35883 RepID=UPI000900BB5B|nr:PREDICTED: uncharacterized protein LOC109187345 [Ipomoea nil]